jgi:hypothetical protein
MLKEELFSPRLVEDDVVIPNVGTVRVRALSRIEVLTSQRLGKDGNAGAAERVMLSYGMVDPKLTQDEVSRWQKASPAGEIEPVTDRIAELSGLKEYSEKAAYKRTGDGPELGVRDVSCPETVDDGVTTPI